MDLLRNILFTKNIVPKEVSLKVGAQVMMVTNDFEEGLVNGSTGVVLEFVYGSDGQPSPVVKFTNGVTKVVGRKTFTKTMRGVGRLCREQVPLILSWAVTVHKVQGVTVDNVIVDLSRIWLSGQSYVALSRATALGGLEVRNFKPNRVFTNPLVVRFYEAMRKSPEALSAFLEQDGMWWGDDIEKYEHWTRLFRTNPTFREWQDERRRELRPFEDDVPMP